MSFSIKRYYLVTANADLVKLIERYNQKYQTEFDLIFLEPTVWYVRENSHALVYEHPQLHQLMLMYLVDLYNEYVRPNQKDEGLLELLRETLGEPPFTTTIFLKWWQVETLGGGVVTFEEYEATMKNIPQFHEWIASEHKAVAHWIQKFKPL